jgi:hypothetical protein
VFIVTGCFHGSVAAFIVAVNEKHRDTEHGRAYHALIQKVMELANWTPAKE